MADIYGSYFEYNGVGSKLYNLILANLSTTRMESSYGNISGNTIYSKTNNKRFLINDDLSNSPFSYDLEIITEDQSVIPYSTRRSIEQWLFNSPRYHKLYINNDIWGVSSINTSNNNITLQSTVGGSVIVDFNQLAKNGNFASVSDWSTTQTSYTVSGNVATVSTSEAYGGIKQSIPSGKAGHKILFVCDFFLVSYSTSYAIPSLCLSGVVPISSNWQASPSRIYGWQTVSFITDIYSEHSEFWIRWLNDTNKTAPNYKIRNCMFIDLTQIYGIGNEPNSLSEFKYTFNEAYYAYTLSTLMSKNININNISDISIGDDYSIKTNDYYNYVGKVTAKNGNVITVDGLPPVSTLSQDSIFWLPKYADPLCDTDMGTYNDRYYFNCRFINPEKIISDGGVIGYKVTLESDSGYLWRNTISEEFSINSGSGTGLKYITVNVNSDGREYIYPEVKINIGTAGGNISIINSTDSPSRITSFSNLTASSQIIMRGDIGYISGGYFSNMTNLNFIRLLPGSNAIAISGNVSSITIEHNDRRIL